MNNLFILPLTAAVRISSTIEETISKASETWPFISTSFLSLVSSPSETSGASEGGCCCWFVIAGMCASSSI
jgi:hypothetical protein